ncbi:hypothetical protein LEMLEM_LOCUS7912 [Lemmus lemmus]
MDTKSPIVNKRPSKQKEGLTEKLMCFIILSTGFSWKGNWNKNILYF